MVKLYQLIIIYPLSTKLIRQKSVLIFLFSTSMIYLKTVSSLALDQVFTFTVSQEGVLPLKINLKKIQNPTKLPKGTNMKRAKGAK